MIEICLKCVIDSIPRHWKSEKSDTVKAPAVLGVNLSGDEYARYLDIRNKVGLPQSVYTE